MTKVIGLKQGSTPAERAVINVQHTAVPTADPTSYKNGLHAQGGDQLHIYLDRDPTITAVDLTPWYWSEDAEKWVESDQLNFGATANHAVLPLNGEARVAIVVDSVTGTGNLKVFLGASHTGKDAA
jgi:hypothetical protein